MGRRGYFGKDGSDWESWQRRNWEPLLDSMRRACRQSAQRPSRGLAAGAVSGGGIRILKTLKNSRGWGDRRARRGGRGGWGFATVVFFVGSWVLFFWGVFFFFCCGK